MGHSFKMTIGNVTLLPMGFSRNIKFIGGKHANANQEYNLIKIVMVL